MKEGGRKAKIFFDGAYAGILEETDYGYSFTYDSADAIKPHAQSISLTMPLQENSYHSKTFFFDF